MKYKVNTLAWISMLSLGVAACIYVAYIAHAIYIDRALFADGSNFFVTLLNTINMWPIVDDSKHIRLFTNILNQLPVSIALIFGVDDIPILRKAFGAGLFVTPILLYFFCFQLSKRASDYRVFFISMLNLISCAMPSDIFILNQSFTTLALTWILIHYILLTLHIRWFDWLVILLISLFLFRAHESLIIFGGIFFLAASTIILVRDRKQISNENLHIYTIGLIGVMHAIFVAFWQSTHPVAEQTSDFLELLSLLNPSELWLGNTRISILLTFCIICVFLYDLTCKNLQKNKKLFCIFSLCAIITLSIFMLYTGGRVILMPELTNPGREFSYRFLMVFGSGGWMLVAIGIIALRVNPQPKSKHLYSITLSLGLISASIWQISNNIQWSLFTYAVSQELEYAPGPFINASQVQSRLTRMGNTDVFKYRWDWAWPVLGISLQNDGEIKKLFTPEEFNEYFKPPTIVPFVTLNNNGPYRLMESLKSREGMTP